MALLQAQPTVLFLAVQVLLQTIVENHFVQLIVMSGEIDAVLSTVKTMLFPKHVPVLSINHCGKSINFNIARPTCQGYVVHYRDLLNEKHGRGSLQLKINISMMKNRMTLIQESTTLAPVAFIVLKHYVP